ncbi:MAG: DUF4097 family beta strand repeat-containing protein [Acidobacteriota bacterium]|nr:DUF4097 family beta strand repeat-containing protein [Acidobacteriota bacterium]
MKKETAMYSILYLALALIPLDAPAQEHGDWVIEKLTWKEEVATGTPIEIVNEYGDIRIRSHGLPNQVEIIANSQRVKTDERMITLEPREVNGGWVINVVYKGKDEDTVKKRGKRRLDLTLLVPQGSPLTAKTFKGLLEAKGLDAHADLYSERGKIFLRTKSSARVGSRQGNIRTVFQTVKWAQASEFYSILGNIEVELPADASLKVTAATAGHITSDYSMEIQRDRNTFVKNAKITIDDGKHQLNIDNKEGDVRIIEGRWNPKQK